MSLTDRIRTRILSGLLPRAADLPYAGGSGGGDQCVCCDEYITPDDIEYQVIDRSIATTYPMHLHCYGLWQNTTREIGPGTPDGAVDSRKERE